MENELKENKWYSLKDLVEGKMLAGLSSWRAVRDVVRRDKENRNLLKAIISGEGRGKKYRIKGSNLKTFLEEWESGDYKL